MNKSVMKCCICNNENIGEFVTINDKKYHLCCIEQLQQENQELKRKLNETIHKATEFESEVYELKKQLEEKENIACDWKDSCLENAGKIEILETQQKEFISYLENEININPYDISDYVYEDIINTILSKYKEIIGENNE